MRHMRHRTIQTVVALLLIAFGWVAGRAKTPAPEFTLRIEAPSGGTKVKYVRGGTLQGVETRVIPTIIRGRNIGSTAVPIRLGAVVPR